MTASRPAALIVDGHPFVGLVASDILGECGFETFHAYDALEAARVLEEHPEIELLVSENQLPGDRSGLDLCREVSRQHPEVQLIVTSSGETICSNELPRGATTLRKPYASGELRTMVARKLLLEDIRE